MNRKFKILIIISLLIFLSLNKLYAFENKILFKVNNEVITSIDIYEEVKFLKVFNKEINELSKKELLEISKNSIVRDKIKKVEIMNYVKELKIEDRFLLKFIKDRYSKINLNSIEDFENFLRNNNLNIKNVREKIAIELIWNDIICQKFSSKINIDKNKIKNE